MLLWIVCTGFNAMAADQSCLLDQIMQRGHILVGTTGD
jgi:hypothetical protein